MSHQQIKIYNCSYIKQLVHKGCAQNKWRIQDFPGEDANFQTGGAILLIWTFFCWKLVENERI